MSRTGKKPVAIPAGVTASIEGGVISVKGPKGTLSITAADEVTYTLEDGKIQVEKHIPAETIAKLNALGHVCEPIAKPHGGGQAIYMDHDRGVLIGGTRVPLRVHDMRQPP